MDGLSPAKQTLLRALDSIEEIEADLGAEVRHVAVVYSVYRFDEADGMLRENSGWNHSSDPAWIIAALLRRVAKRVDSYPQTVDDGEN
jgi:hypothetical protein